MYTLCKFTKLGKKWNGSKVAAFCSVACTVTILLIFVAIDKDLWKLGTFVNGKSKIYGAFFGQILLLFHRYQVGQSNIQKSSHSMFKYILISILILYQKNLQIFEIGQKLKWLKSGCILLWSVYSYYITYFCCNR